jgi:hypothetical protein
VALQSVAHWRQRRDYKTVGRSEDAHRYTSHATARKASDLISRTNVMASYSHTNDETSRVSISSAGLGPNSPRRLLHPWSCDQYVVPKRRYGITTQRYIISQKSANLFHVAAEAWDHAQLRYDYGRVPDRLTTTNLSTQRPHIMAASPQSIWPRHQLSALTG